MEQMPQCKKVIYVTGAGHSGTTLLGMMLGSANDAIYAGEVQESRFFGSEEIPTEKSICRTCGKQCPLWSNIQTSDNIYETLVQRSKRHTIVDSSKRIREWIHPQSSRLKESSTALSMVLIMRDPRAVVASNLRKRPEISAFKYSKSWAYKIRSFEKFTEQFPGEVTIVQYEELVTNPVKALKIICGNICIEYNDTMLTFWKKEHHQIHGNVGAQAIASGLTTHLGPAKMNYYASHPKAIVLDERWIKELSEQALQEIEAGAGEFYQKYLWPSYKTLSTV